jgi:hypothetical protein
MRPSSSLQGTQFLNPPQIGGQPGYGNFQHNMWSNPQLQQMGGWQPAFPMQFLPPQMMQGTQMQFPPPVQFNQQQFPMFNEQAGM